MNVHFSYKLSRTPDIDREIQHGTEKVRKRLQVFRPELVHLDRIENSSEHAHASEMDKLRRTRSYQPVLTDIRSIAPTGWYGSPQPATADRGRRMVGAIADAIAKEASQIFRQLDAVHGGVGEIKKLHQVG